MNRKTWLYWSCFGLICLVCTTLFIENFVYSQNFGLLEFRETDDLAFQAVLQNIHILISAHQYRQLFIQNSYAYGWIFWFPMALLTYPAHLLNIHSGITWPLIVIPRQLSLVYGMLALVVMYNMLKRYSSSHTTCMLGTAFFSLFATLGYFSERFGTVNQIMFFALLAAFLSVRKDKLTLKDLCYVVLALAAAGATKLNGLMIGPFIALSCWYRIEKTTPKEIAKQIFVASLIFIVAFIFLTNPSLFAVPFDHSLWQTYVSTMRYYLNNIQTNYGTFSVKENLRQGILGVTVSIPVFLLLFLGLFINIFSKKSSALLKKDSLSAIICLTITSLYLIFRIKMGRVMWCSILRLFLFFYY